MPNSDTTPATPDPDAADVAKNKIYAVLAYLGILFLVPLLAAPDSKFARYHTNQGIVLFLTGLGCGVVARVIALTPGVNAILTVMPLVWLAVLVLAIMGIVNAASGQCKPLPVIGRYRLLK